MAEQHRGTAQPHATLVPVTLVSEDAVADVPSTEPVSAAGQIEVVLAGGTVRIQGSVDATMLQLALSSLRR